MKQIVQRLEGILEVIANNKTISPFSILQNKLNSPSNFKNK